MLILIKKKKTFPVFKHIKKLSNNNEAMVETIC